MHRFEGLVKKLSVLFRSVRRPLLAANVIVQCDDGEITEFVSIEARVQLHSLNYHYRHNLMKDTIIKR